MDGNKGQSAQLKLKRNAQNNATGGATEPPLPYPTGLEFPPLLQLPIFFLFFIFFYYYIALICSDSALVRSDSVSICSDFVFIRFSLLARGSCCESSFFDAFTLSILIFRVLLTPSAHAFAAAFSCVRRMRLWHSLPLDCMIEKRVGAASLSLFSLSFSRFSASRPIDRNI